MWIKYLFSTCNYLTLIKSADLDDDRFSTSSGMVLEDPAKFPPSFRMSRSGYASRPGLRLRNTRAQPKPRFLHAFKRGASVFKASMPKIKDVNIIDKYSRVIFPVSFLIFNSVYWVFYVVWGSSISPRVW